MTPDADLAPLIRLAWSAEAAEDGRPARASREWSLPTGVVHVVFRASDDPVRLHETAEDFGFGVIGGPRTRAYLRHTERPVATVGIQLVPGAARAVLGVPAEAIAERHVRAEDLWGSSAVGLRDRLCEAAPADRVRVLQDFVRARVRGGVDPVVAHVVAGIRRGAPLGAVYGGTGYSEKHVVARFRREVGLTPKRYARLLRFHRGLRGGPWAEIALAAGYYDQAHLVRDFREFAGMTPSAWRAAAGEHPLHVPAPG